MKEKRQRIMQKKEKKLPEKYQFCPPSSSVMVTIAIAGVSTMNMEKASFPSSARLSFTTRSVKSMQAPVPGGGMVMVVPPVKSESVNSRLSL